MHGMKYEDAKKEIRSVLLTYQNSVTLDEFTKTYRSLVGQRLPSRELGFSNDVALLKSMPDVVDLQYDSQGKVFLNGIADEASQHIQKLVSRQRNSKPNNSRRNQSRSRQPVRKLPSTLPTTRELKPFLPGGLRVEILELMNSYTEGVTLSGFALAYHRKYKKLLPLAQGLNTLEGIIKQMPEFELENNDGQIRIYHKKFFNNFRRENRSHGKTQSSSGFTIGNSTIEEKSSTIIDDSGIPDDILNDFQMVLQKYPDGIQNIHFPPLYEKLTGKLFDVSDLGYSSMADLVEALPHIFRRVSNPDDKQCWLIYPSGSHIQENFNAKNGSGDSPKQHLYPHREGIPADVSSPLLQYIPSSIPGHINLNTYVPVFVSAIANPSLFWFQLQTDEFIEKFEKLERDMENFYLDVGHKYKMNNADIAIGATCVIQCPDDNNFYRAVIKAIPSTESINVSFVDYGSRDNVPRNNLYYVWSKLHEYPAYALKAQLDNLKPSQNADSWSSQARKRFVELCNAAALMALIKPIDKDSYSVSLCDTSTEDDIYLHDILINEGYAENCSQSPFNPENNNLNEPERNTHGHNIPVDYDSGFASSQDKSQSVNSDIFCESNELPVNRKLSFSTDVGHRCKPAILCVHTTKGQVGGPTQPLHVERSNKGEDSAVHSNAARFSLDKSSQRYIKQVEVCEGKKIHLIKLKDKLFMSCDELCSLLWKEKNTNFLTRSLMHKEINIPFLHVKKEDHPELFKQCLWYKVPGIEKKASENFSLILSPLEEAFNVLNIFGHPSVCLRMIIQQEKRIFDPHDKFWNEFFCEEFPDLSLTENGILEEINKLCLYDLKAKSEAFKVQKLKLLRVHANPNNEEVKRIENILSIITRRMKQIEAICSQYSSCS